MPPEMRRHKQLVCVTTTHRTSALGLPRGRGVLGIRRRESGFALIRFVVWLASLPVILFAAWIWLVWPPPAWYRWSWPGSTAFMRMREKEAERAAGTAKEAPPVIRHYQPVPLEAMAPHVKNAVLVAEDHRFYDHHGIDYVELRKALGYRRDSFSIDNARDRRDLTRAVTGAFGRRDRLRGASTITQQLAKNLYLSSSRSPLRKLKEAVTAWRLEYWLGKERILELYLNVAELGPDVWGVEAASQKYFRRSARELSQAQAAMLAGTLPFPLSSNPSFRPGRMKWRQSLILRRLRGEEIEVPPVLEIPEAPIVVTPDTIPVPVLPDSVVDTLSRRK